MVLFLNGANDLAMETDEVVAPRATFDSGISSRSPRSLGLEIHGGELPATGEDQDRDYMGEFDP